MTLKVFPSFCVSTKILIDSFVIFCFLRLKLFPIAMRFSAEILSPYGGFPSQCGFLEFVVFSLIYFAEPSATRNTNSASLWVIRTSFAFSLLKYISMTPNFPILQTSVIRISSLQDLSAKKAWPIKSLVVIFFQLDQFMLRFSRGFGRYPTNAPNRTIGPLSDSPDLSSYQDFPFARRFWTSCRE